MRCKFFVFACLCLVLLCGRGNAISPADYADRFKIDLDTPLPKIEDLRIQFAPAPVYDRKYKYYWSIGNKFDKEFAQTIRKYGTREKRLKWQGEDEYYEMIKSMPPQMYEYIGPYLHTVPGIPEKVLNMPGIKETKNKFPSRIAPQLADIEDIEMISPVLYFLLMPEMWPDENAVEEIVMPEPMPEPANKYNSKLLDDIAKKLSPQDYAPGATAKSNVKSRLRTISPDKNSPLTSADVKAVISTLEDLKSFGSDIVTQVQLVEAGYLLDAWEEANGTGVGLAQLKDLVTPCARLVQKIRLIGKSTEFQSVISKKGFSENEWAYTCDKTIKAYRLLRMSQVELLTIRLFRKNIFQHSLQSYNYKYGPKIAATMQSMIERYDATIDDMLEVKKNSKELDSVLRDSKFRIVGQEIFMK